MTDPGPGKRLPRSYEVGRLLRLLASDMPDHRLEPDGPARGRFVPSGSGPVIEVVEKVERRFLGHTEIAQFRVVARAADFTSARIEIRHTGNLKRQGVAVDVLNGGESTHRLAVAISDDESFTTPGKALDFTRFDVVRSGGQWMATVELMGASFVSLALPPMRSYVRLYDDQRKALVATLNALVAHLDGG